MVQGYGLRVTGFRFYGTTVVVFCAHLAFGVLVVAIEDVAPLCCTSRVTSCMQGTSTSL